MSSAQSHAQRVLSVLNQQRALGKLCDAALSVGEGLVRLAHRNILACFSDMFQDMANVQDTLVVTLKDCPEDGLELLLDFIYTGELPLDRDNCQKVQLAAASLCVPEVVAQCQQFNQQPPQTPQPSSQTPQPPQTPPPQQITKTRRGRPKRKDTETVVVQQSSPKYQTWTDAVKESPSGAEVPEAPAADGEVGPSRTVADEEQTTAEEEVIKADVEATDVDRATSETEPNIEQDTADDPDFEDVAEDFADSGDQDYDPETSVLAPDEKKNKSKSKDGVNGASDGGVQCSVCNKTFKSKYYLKVHNRRHTGEKPFACGKCGKRYFRKENLLEHQAKDCGATSQIHSCPTCSETFPRKSQLTSHLATHSGDMPNKCPICPEQFMLKKHLLHHMSRLHGFAKPHQCSECDKSFMTKSELRIHDSAKHKGEKPFVCEECGHRASSRNGLKMHIKALHRHDKPHVCPECGHAFTQKNNLTMHMLVHSGEKPFMCHLCGKTFRTQGTLDKHNRTHTGERPFSCEFCAQKFTEKGAMLRHVESKHQEGRPHSCNICGKTFKARDQLRVHLNRHKGERKFECVDCGYKFTRQAHLRRHTLVHKRTENYNPKVRKFRNVIVDSLEDTSGIEESVKIVQASLKKKTKKKLKKKKKKKEHKSKKIKTAVKETEDSCSGWIAPVESIEEEAEVGRKVKEEVGLLKTEELEQEPMDLEERAVEIEDNPEAFETTVDLSQIAEEPADSKT